MTYREWILQVLESNLALLVSGKKIEQKVPLEWNLRQGDSIKWESGKSSGIVWVVSSTVVGEELDCSFFKI